MRRFVEGVDRGQSTLFPECLEDWTRFRTCWLCYFRYFLLAVHATFV
jgi:hypothetical protein